MCSTLKRERQSIFGRVVLAIAHRRLSSWPFFFCNVGPLITFGYIKSEVYIYEITALKIITRKIQDCRQLAGPRYTCIYTLLAHSSTCHGKGWSFFFRQVKRRSMLIKSAQLSFLAPLSHARTRSVWGLVIVRTYAWRIPSTNDGCVWLGFHEFFFSLLTTNLEY